MVNVGVTAELAPVSRPKLGAIYNAESKRGHSAADGERTDESCLPPDNQIRHNRVMTTSASRT